MLKRELLRLSNATIQLRPLALLGIAIHSPQPPFALRNSFSPKNAVEEIIFFV
jgi:hypothetical protein